MILYDYILLMLLIRLCSVYVCLCVGVYHGWSGTVNKYPLNWIVPIHKEQYNHAESSFATKSIPNYLVCALCNKEVLQEAKQIENNKTRKNSCLILRYPIYANIFIKRFIAQTHFPHTFIRMRHIPTCMYRIASYHWYILISNFRGIARNSQHVNCPF